MKFVEAVILLNAQSHFPQGECGLKLLGVMAVWLVSIVTPRKGSAG